MDNRIIHSFRKRDHQLVHLDFVQRDGVRYLREESLHTSDILGIAPKSQAKHGLLSPCHRFPLQMKKDIHGHARQRCGDSAGLFAVLVPAAEPEYAVRAYLPVNRTRRSNAALKCVEAFAGLIKHIPRLAEVPQTDSEHD